MIKVRVPATSANMGPGFDSLGVALNLYNIFGFREIEDGLSFKGVPEEFCNKENIIYQAMMKCFNKGGYKPKGIEISALKQAVPVSRGLGSSSSCIVGGLVGANELLGRKFSKDEILQMAVEIEGHPDNVAPAVFGDMIVAIMEDEKVYHQKINVCDKIRFVSIIPNFRLSTSEARSVLPKEISLKDGIYNVGRASLLVAAISNENLELLKYACKDSFHEKYRSNLIRGFDEVKKEVFRLEGIASYLSGAGPTIMAISLKENIGFSDKIKEFLKIKGLEWDVYELSVDKVGAIVLEGD
ncbi:homoserine kinase [Clostridium sp. SHJSY1]|uniref:homoserine kinase n=1 Tax=Clostridium sp. SHJSY1 TaxID=2942483 RepID=UPI002876FEA7|nr:homoserine kinase [Clostridium sp. SHJSY1]MDS0525068.1 homoserine kinase [Clostridium sp. SHJSY1]